MTVQVMCMRGWVCVTCMHMTSTWCMMMHMMWLAGNDLQAEGAWALVHGLQSLPGLTSLLISGDWDEVQGWQTANVLEISRPGQPGRMTTRREHSRIWISIRRRMAEKCT